MKDDAASFDDDFDDLDEAETEEDDRGISGLVVLLMGFVMLGAVASVVWIAYTHGVKTGARDGAPPYVTADPEPLKIENTVADAAAASVDGVDRQVYDRFEGTDGEPVEVIAQGPEEPVVRSSYESIGDIAAAAAPAAEDAVADRIAELAAQDAELNQSAQGAEKEGAPRQPAKPATQPTPVSVPADPPAETSKGAGPAPSLPTVTYRNEGAASGTHLVQVGAFRSQAEADAQWASLKSRLGAFAADKSEDVERADLGDKGTFYRLRIGPFASADEAKTYCAGLKERGTDCLIKAK